MKGWAFIGGECLLCSVSMLKLCVNKPTCVKTKGGTYPQQIKKQFYTIPFITRQLKCIEFSTLCTIRLITSHMRNKSVHRLE